MIFVGDSPPDARQWRIPSGKALGRKTVPRRRSFQLFRAGTLASSIAIVITSTTCSAQEDMSNVNFIAHEMHIRENGDYALKSWHNMSRRNFAYAITETCSSCNVGLIQFDPDTFGRSNFMTTGRIDKQAGDQWWVTFPGPNEFNICSASINSQRDIFVNEGNSTSGKVLRNPHYGENWVESVNSVPKSGAEGHGVDVRFIAKYVAAGKEGDH